MQGDSRFVNSNNLMDLAFINTIGLQILTQSFKSAEFYIKHTSFVCTWNNQKKFRSYMREGSDSLAFINGTGLDIMLEEYSLAYNSDQLRDGFFYFLRKSNGNGKH